MKVYHNSVEVESCGECPNCRVTGDPSAPNDWFFYCDILRTEEEFENIDGVTEYRVNNTISPYCPLDDLVAT